MQSTFHHNFMWREIMVKNPSTYVFWLIFNHNFPTIFHKPPECGLICVICIKMRFVLLYCRFESGIALENAFFTTKTQKVRKLRKLKKRLFSQYYFAHDHEILVHDSTLKMLSNDI